MQLPADLKQFYEDWAWQQLEDPRRTRILEWKADNMVPLVRQTGLQFNSAMELGCAEGTVLNRLGNRLNISNLCGVDMSQTFIDVGQKRHPYIKFVNENWENLAGQTQPVDLLLISDFIEHLPNPDQFLEKIKPLAKHFIFKIPLEKCLMINLYQVLGRRAKIGPQHPSGHLQEYHEQKALDLLKTHGYTLLQTRSLVTPFQLQYPGPQQWYLHPSVAIEKMAHLLPLRWQLGLIGGSLFALCAR